MEKNQIPYKIYLSENELPREWYNLRADMTNKPAPLLDPTTHKPITAEALSAVFCDEAIRQELDDTTRFFKIPDVIRAEKLRDNGDGTAAYSVEHATGSDIRRDVFNAMARIGCPILDMQSGNEKLEDMFLKLTSGSGRNGGKI